MSQSIRSIEDEFLRPWRPLILACMTREGRVVEDFALMKRNTPITNPEGTMAGRLAQFLDLYSPVYTPDGSRPVHHVVEYAGNLLVFIEGGHSTILYFVQPDGSVWHLDYELPHDIDQLLCHPEEALR